MPRKALKKRLYFEKNRRKKQDDQKEVSTSVSNTPLPLSGLQHDHHYTKGDKAATEDVFDTNKTIAEELPSCTDGLALCSLEVPPGANVVVDKIVHPTHSSLTDSEIQDVDNRIEALPTNVVVNEIIFPTHSGFTNCEIQDLDNRIETIPTNGFEADDTPPATVLIGEESSAILVGDNTAHLNVPQSRTVPRTPSISPECPLSDETRSEVIPDYTLLMKVALQLSVSFWGSNDWVVKPSDKGIQLLLLSKRTPVVIQRTINVFPGVRVDIQVHGSPLTSDHEIWKELPQFLDLTESSVDAFADYLKRLTIVMALFPVCCGVPQEQYKCFWAETTAGIVDNDLFKETRYTDTCRSKNCTLLVNQKKTRCDPCTTLYSALRGRKKKSITPSDRTTYKNMSKEEVVEKAKLLHLSNKSQKQTIKRLRENVKKLLKTSGISIDTCFDKDLKDSLADADMTPVQRLFMEQMIKAASVKKSCGMRWHPAMIRWALLVRMKSPAAYEAMKDSGFIKLPSSRTLFDYSHHSVPKEGVDMAALDNLRDHLLEQEEPYKHYLVEMLDEMNVSRNLVVKKTGEVVGFTKLSEAEEEIRELEQLLMGENCDDQPPLASKMLCFMIKTVAGRFKKVIASYTTTSLTADDLYRRHWEVVKAVEKKTSGIIVAVVCDGSGVNRRFFKMHTPITPLTGITGEPIVFATRNLFDHTRVIYFISDPPHLIKTARNCFANSGEGPKKTRRMQKNGEFIEWKTILRMYFQFKDDPLRLCHKLNTQVVFLNSYSRMTVSYAAQVLSATVAKCLQMLQWEGTGETVTFITYMNNVFDCVNGAYAMEAQRKRNPYLEKYEQEDDWRFNYMEEFLGYVKEWWDEAHSGPGTKTENGKKTLSRETIEGWEIAIRGFTGAVKFLLQKGMKFVNGRIFCQDSLEQNFGRQRSACGGSNNPSVDRYLSTQNSIRVQGELGADVKRGNTKSKAEWEFCDTPLHKRNRKS